MSLNQSISLSELDKMTLDEAHRLPFAARDALLDLVLQDGRKLLGAQIERQRGLFSDYIEEDLVRLSKIRAVRLVCSGFIPIDPQGEVTTLDMRGQCRVVFENMKAALTKMGSSLDRVVSMTLFLKNMDFWETMNGVYREYFQRAPTRAAIGVQSLNRTYQIEVAGVVAYKVAG